MFDGLFDKETLERVEEVTTALSDKHTGRFFFAIPYYHEDGKERPCDSLDTGVRVYTPDPDVRRANPPFGTHKDWSDYGALVVAKPLGKDDYGVGAVIPISMIERLNPDFMVMTRIMDSVRQNWYEEQTFRFLRQLQEKLRG